MKSKGFSADHLTYEDDAGWLVTYADLMTLLMVFFVLLYSLATFEKERYKTTIASLKSIVEKQPEMEGIMTFMGQPDGFDKKIRIDEITGLRNRDAALYRSMERLVENADPKDRLGLEASHGKIIITIPGETLFSSGSARLNSRALPAMDNMIELLEDYEDYTINIKGHTDNLPITTRQFPSNWELSAIRATTVLKHLIAKGIDPKRLTATGYGELLPLADNTTEENRAKNRRVEFVLEKLQNR